MINSDNMKHLIRMTVFIVLTAILLLLLTPVLTPKDFTSTTIYSEPEHTLDAVFVGSSHIMSAISPAQLWREQGFTSYVMYSWSQPTWTSYYHIKQLLKKQSPKVVVVDALGCSYGQFSFMPEQVDAVSNEFSLGMPMSLNRLKLAVAMARCQATKAPASTYIPLLKYHARWKYLTKDDFTQAFAPPSHNIAKGYGPIYVQEAQEQLQYPDNIVQGELNPHAQEYLYKLIRLCKANGTKLVMLLSPHVFSEGEYELYARVEAICAENDVELINYNKPELLARSGFSFAEDMAEAEHVNYHGALKLTADIGQYLADNYELGGAQHPQELSDVWDADAAVMQRDDQNMELRLSATATAMAQRLSAKGYVACVSTKGELNQGGDGKKEAVSFLSALGLDANIVQASGQCAAIIQDGKPIAQQYGDNASVTAQCAGKSFSSSATFAQSSITIDGEQHSRNREGINVVVYDEVSGKMLISISYNAYDGYKAMTN